MESPANAGTTESASSLAVTNELQSIPDSLKPENVENGESKIQCPGTFVGPSADRVIHFPELCRPAPTDYQ